jgi:hypothetical protein
VGLSSVAGMLAPAARGGGRGVHVRLVADPREAAVVLQVALAPGLVAPVGVAAVRELAMGETVEPAAVGGTLALDGEREIERRPGARATVRLVTGPRTIDVDAVMRHAAVSGATRTPRGEA